MLSQYLCLFILSLSNAAPLPPQETEPPYAPQPSGRGTIELLTSCTMTIVLCIWTAIHPDIVIVRSSRYSTLYKVYWGLFAVIIPEFLVYCAVAQYRQARKLHKTWKKAWGDRPEKDWLGMPGAFFVVMGGYIITRTKSLEQKEITTENQCDNNATPTDRAQTPEGTTLTLGRREYYYRY